MRVFTFVCARGHQTDRELPQGKKPTFTRCTHKRCGRRAMYNVTATFRGSLRADVFPDHFNISFDQRIGSKREYKTLQRIHGTKDWEPVKESRHTERLRKEGLL